MMTVESWSRNFHLSLFLGCSLPPFFPHIICTYKFTFCHLQDVVRSFHTFIEALPTAAQVPISAYNDSNMVCLNFRQQTSKNRYYGLGCFSCLEENYSCFQPASKLTRHCFRCLVHNEDCTAVNS